MAGLELNEGLLDDRLDGASFGAKAAGMKVRPYLADQSLTTASALAILLGQPLLLSGLPGVGKTGAAYHIASSLFGADGEPVRLTVTTQTSGRDLLYRFDTLGRFHDKGRPLREFLRFEALGRAIASACGGLAILLDAATDTEITDIQRIAEIIGLENAKTHQGPLRLRDLLRPSDAVPDRPMPTIVLIDEIDKAPRDTPNDLLESFEAMRFTIDELGLKIGWRDAADSDAQRRRSRPVVVATTNAENNLPDAFLRRCVFHEISMPDTERMKAIVAAHLEHIDRMAKAAAHEHADAVLTVGEAVTRKISATARAPGTAEYIALARGVHAAHISSTAFLSALDRPTVPPVILKALMGVFVKTADDLRKALQTFPGAA